MVPVLGPKALYILKFIPREEHRGKGASSAVGKFIHSVQFQ